MNTPPISNNSGNTTTNPPSNPPAVPDPNAYLTEKQNPEDLGSTWRRSKCSNCGFLYEGMKVPTKCPKCGKEGADLFIESD
ncbi:hypothetical protein JW710_01910 [Candidatus Dojkabacteria bacterium]|nr:hypothetical protein [Candidatus Dojkabacteria bacterium]